MRFLLLFCACYALVQGQGLNVCKYSPFKKTEIQFTNAPDLEMGDTNFVKKMVVFGAGIIAFADEKLFKNLNLIGYNTFFLCVVMFLDSKSFFILC